jgi:hypothetical protein
MTLFDAYIFVDWSARNGLSPATPRKDTIWIGELLAEGDATETYCRGRSEATALVRDRLVGHVAEERRVLVGFDFPYGYPSGFAAALGSTGEPWRDVWDVLSAEVDDAEDNVSNRFEAAANLNRRIGGGPGPFWGCGARAVPGGLTGTKKGLFDFPFASRGGDLGRLRITDTALSGVQEVWKLSGAGSVGSQALVRIPRVRQLQDDPALAEVSAVWPFETGLTEHPVPKRGPFVLHAEIWPGIIDSDSLDRETADGTLIRDAAQVRLMCRWARDLDTKGALAGWFNPSSLTTQDRRVIGEEEGWILGAEGAVGRGQKGPTFRLRPKGRTASGIEAHLGTER